MVGFWVMFQGFGERLRSWQMDSQQHPLQPLNKGCHGIICSGDISRDLVLWVTFFFIQLKDIAALTELNCRSQPWNGGHHGSDMLSWLSKKQMVTFFLFCLCGKLQHIIRLEELLTGFRHQDESQGINLSGLGSKNHKVRTISITQLLMPLSSFSHVSSAI